MINIPISYKRLFGNKHHGSREDRVKDISSKWIVLVLSTFNHLLHTKKTQKEIFNFISRNWSDEYRDHILNSAHIIADYHESDLIFFNEWIVTENIKFELLNYRDLNHEKDDTTPLDEYNIFISYLMFVDEVLDGEEFEFLKEKSPRTKSFSFQQMHWPIFAHQHEFKTTSNSLLELAKGNLLLSELLKHKEYSKFCEAYLQRYNANSIWELLSTFQEIEKSIIKQDNSLSIPVFTVTPDTSTSEFVMSRTISIQEYIKNERLQIRYLGLKAYPFFELRPRQYIVLNWSFVHTQLSLGLFFHFYQNSGIKTIFKELPDFRSFVGKLISEEKLFRATLLLATNATEVEIYYSDEEGHPDAYIRTNKTVILFEFKDVLFPDHNVEIGTYESIKKVIDQKFVKNSKGKPKGVTQLANQINRMKVKPFEFDDFQSRGIKNRNIRIVPIIVYDVQQFTMPGINDYLSEIFMDLVDKNGFKHIYPLTLISLDYIFKNAARIRKHGFLKFIKSYHDNKRKYFKEYSKTKNSNSLASSYNAIEYTKIKLTKEKIGSSDQNREKIIKYFENLNFEFED